MIYNVALLPTVQQSESVTHIHMNEEWVLVAQSGLTLCDHALLQGIFPDPGIEPRSLEFQADSLPSEPPEKPHSVICWS